jgi:hypothetical protein
MDAHSIASQLFRRIHARAPDANETSDESITNLARDVLRDALLGAPRDPAHARRDDAEAQAALRPLCDVAHARGLHVEQVLILLKDTWRELPEAQHALPSHDATILADVITACIAEYYAPRRSS